MDAALTAGYARAFGVAAALSVVAFAASFIVPSIGPKRTEESPAAHAVEAAVDGGEASLPTLDPARAGGG